MATLLDRLDEFLSFYGAFINDLGIASLLCLAAATIASGVYSLSHTVIDNRLRSLTSSPSLYTSNTVEATSHNLRRRSSIPPAGASLRRLFGFEPLRSVRSLYVLVICVSAYLHVLILLAILRLREDHGISKGYLFAVLRFVVPIAETNLQRILIVFVTVFLSTIGNLQLHHTPPPPPPIPPTDHPILPLCRVDRETVEVRMSRKEWKKFKAWKRDKQAKNFINVSAAVKAIQ